MRRRAPKRPFLDVYRDHTEAIEDVVRAARQCCATDEIYRVAREKLRKLAIELREYEPTPRRVKKKSTSGE